MKIERSSLHGPTPMRRKDKASGSANGFAEALEGGDTGGDAKSTSQSGGVSNLDSLLSLQEVPDATGGRGRARQRSERILDRLAELRDSLLVGRMAASTVRRLADEVDSARAQVDDPRLNEILDEIDLRAQVELAKLRR